MFKMPPRVDSRQEWPASGLPGRSGDEAIASEIVGLAALDSTLNSLNETLFARHNIRIHALVEAAEKQFADALSEERLKQYESWNSFQSELKKVIHLLQSAREFAGWDAHIDRDVDRAFDNETQKIYNAFLENQLLGIRQRFGSEAVRQKLAGPELNQQMLKGMDSGEIDSRGDDAVVYHDLIRQGKLHIPLPDHELENIRYAPSWAQAKYEELKQQIEQEPPLEAHFELKTLKGPRDLVRV